MNQKEIKDMENFIKRLPQEKIDEINKKEIENSRQQYKKFKEGFSKGYCYICKSKIDLFDKNMPCVHWLLKPNGFKKEHFKLILQNANYSNIDSYLRWVANQETLLKNINDLSEEKKESMMFEYIIKYKNFEWSFSCSKNDFEGHKNKRQGKYPHYHFQMRIDNLPFINFGDFHIPLSPYDKYVIRVKKNEIKNISYQDGFGAGMESFFKNLSPEEILKHAKTTDNFDKATIHTTYIIQADPGKTISGDELQNLMDESKRTGTPFWNLLPRLKNAKRTAIVSPGDGVPEVFHRKGRNKNKSELNYKNE